MRVRSNSWVTGVSKRLFDFCQPFTDSDLEYPRWTVRRVTEGSLSAGCYSREKPLHIKGYWV